jgi:flagellar biosynthesis chaperone FliJ
MRYFLAGTCATIAQTVSSPVSGRNVTLAPMASNLAALLSLRRSAEEEAVKALGEATATRLRAEEEQRQLDFAAERARQALQQETKRRATATAPGIAADGLQRERYRQRLSEALARAAKKADLHRQGPLNQARTAESTAAARVRQARQERLAIEKLRARQAADQRRQTERRAEDAVGDLVHSSHARRKSSA